MIGIHIEMANLPKVNSAFDAITAGVETLKPLWEQFGKEFYQQEAKLFNAAPWAPLSPAYAEYKRRELGGKPLLRVSDHLLRSFTQEGAPGNIHRIDDLSAEFGSSDFKAILHQLGTDNMPARPPLAEPDAPHYETLAGQYLASVVEKAVSIN